MATAVADYNCERKNITPVETVVREHYQSQFRQQNQNLIAQVKPVH